MPPFGRGMEASSKRGLQGSRYTNIVSSVPGSDRYSTRPVQPAGQSGPQHESFVFPPFKRNTQGFKPPSEYQRDAQDSSSLTPSTAIPPQPPTEPEDRRTLRPEIWTVGGPPDFLPLAGYKAPIPLKDKAAGAKNKENLKPHQRSKQAVRSPLSKADDLYGASIQEPVDRRTKSQLPIRGGGEPTMKPGSSFDKSASMAVSTAAATQSNTGGERTTRIAQVSGKNLASVSPQGQHSEVNRDASEGFTPSFISAPHINLNALSQYAWNNGVKPKGLKSSRLAQQSTASVLSPAHPSSDAPASVPISVKKLSTGKAHGPDNSVREAQGTSEKRVHEMDPIQLHSEMSNKEELAPYPGNGVQLSTTQTQEPRSSPQTSVNYVPPHLRMPKPKPVQISQGPTATETKVDLSAKHSEVSPEAFTQNDTVKVPETTGPDASYLPPHLRPAKAKKSATVAESKTELAPQTAVGTPSDHAGNMEPAGSVLAPPQPSTRDKGKAIYKGDEVNQVVSSGPSLQSPYAKKGPRKLTKMEKLMLKKGYDLPPEKPVGIIGDWARPEEMEEAWEERTPHDYGAPEHFSRAKEWTGKTAIEQPVVIDTSAPEFAQGTYIPVGERLETIIDESAHITHRPDDPYTEVKAGRTAQAAIEEYRKNKGPEEPPKPKLTKAQKQEMRETQMRRKQYFIELERNHPNRPAADIYIRPVEEKDLEDITNIHNWYIKNTATSQELLPKKVEHWRETVEDCRAEEFEFYVAVQKNGKEGTVQNRRGVHEPVCGFVWAVDLLGRQTAQRFTSQLQVFVNHEFLHLGVGRCLIDRMMTVLDINYHPRGGCEWRGETPLKRREVKKVLIEIPYWDQDKADLDSLKWKGDWLTGENEKSGLRFEHMGTMKGIGWKQHKA